MTVEHWMAAGILCLLFIMAGGVVVIISRWDSLLERAGCVAMAVGFFLMLSCFAMAIITGAFL